MREFEIKLSNGQQISIFEYDRKYVISLENKEGEFIATAELNDLHLKKIRDLSRL